MIEVDLDGRIVFDQGVLDMAGNGFDRLDGPYDAKAIGDFTGLTPPKNFGRGLQGDAFAK